MTTRRAVITHITRHLDPAVLRADDVDELRSLAELVRSIADPRLRFDEAVWGTWEASGRRERVRAREVARVELLPDR